MGGSPVGPVEVLLAMTCFEDDGSLLKSEVISVALYRYVCGT